MLILKLEHTELLVQWVWMIIWHVLCVNIISLILVFQKLPNQFRTFTDAKSQKEIPAKLSKYNNIWNVSLTSSYTIGWQCNSWSRNYKTVKRQGFCLWWVHCLYILNLRFAFVCIHVYLCIHYVCMNVWVCSASVCPWPQTHSLCRNGRQKRTQSLIDLYIRIWCF